MVEIIERNSKRVRYTKDKTGELVEVCVLKEDGESGIPILKLNPLNKSGHIRFRSTADSFGNGEATASTMYNDEAYTSSKLTYEKWRDNYLSWFEEYLNSHP